MLLEQCPAAASAAISVGAYSPWLCAAARPRKLRPSPAHLQILTIERLSKSFRIDSFDEYANSQDAEQGRPSSISLRLGSCTPVHIDSRYEATSQSFRIIRCFHMAQSGGLRTRRKSDFAIDFNWLLVRVSQTVGPHMSA